MYVYMFKILHNGGNIDLILRLQRFNAVRKKITLNNIQNLKKSYNENRYFMSACHICSFIIKIK
jgi:hypothetical protein